MRPNCTSHPLLSILAALALVGGGSLVLTTAGCSGDDDSGGSTTITDAGGAAADGAGSISDGASSQDASTEDGGSDAGNTDATTAADTATPDTTAPDTSSADTGAPDTMVADTSSAADAGGGGGANAELIQCLTQKCSAETSACLGDSDCLKAVGCLGNCKGDTTCSLGCGSGLSSAAQQKLLSTMTCATQKGCLGGGGGTGGATCGDGKCDLGEQLTCAKDCPAPVCGDGKCETGEQLTCAKDCPAPVCGDGKCEAGEQLTCAQDCGGGGANMSTCIVQKCSSESTACLIDLAGCSQAGVCAVGCTDSACVAKCGDKLTGAAATKFAALRACIDANCITTP